MCARIAATCEVALYFPRGHYWLSRTLSLSTATLDSPDGNIPLVTGDSWGGATLCGCTGCGDPSSSGFTGTCNPASTILLGSPNKGKPQGPGCCTDVKHLTVVGNTTAVHIMNYPSVNFVEVHLVSNMFVAGAAPLVITNGFEYYFTQCRFSAQGFAVSSVHPSLPHHPAVLMQGADASSYDGSYAHDPWVYMVRFQLCEFNKGGVVYEQSAPGPLRSVGVVSFTFSTCWSESSSMPLLSFTTTAAVDTFRVEGVTITDYSNWDEDEGPRAPLIRFNASNSNHSLDGVTISGSAAGMCSLAYDIPCVAHPAIEMVHGTLVGASISNGHWYDATGVVDSAGQAVGTYSSHSMGGTTFVGDAARLSHQRRQRGGGATLSAKSAHTLLFGLSGESNARMAIDADGTQLFGNGEEQPFDSLLSRPRVVSTTWNFSIGGSDKGSSVATKLAVLGAEPRDICTASHSGIGEASILLSAQVSETGVVKAFAVAVGGGDTVQVNGTLTVVARRATMLHKTDDPVSATPSGDERHCTWTPRTVDCPHVPGLKAPLVDVFYPGLNPKMHAAKLEGLYRGPSLLWVPPPSSAEGSHAGTLLAGAGAKTAVGDGAADNANQTLVLRRSTDLGYTWGPLIFPYKKWEYDRMWTSPQMTFDRTTGTVLLMFANCSTVLSYCTSVLQMRSSDSGATWTPPNEVQSVDTRTPQYPPRNPPGYPPNHPPVSPFFGPTSGTGIQLRPGHPHPNRLIFAMNPGNYGGDELLLSDNQGMSYNKSFALNKANQSELQLVQLGNGSVLAVMRSRGADLGGDCSVGIHNTTLRTLLCESQHKSVAVSTDGGLSFGPIRYHKDLVGPTCQGSVLYVGGSTVLYAGPRKSGILPYEYQPGKWTPFWEERTQMTVLASDDNGDNFNRSLLVYPGSGNMYSSLQLLPTGEVVLLFERYTSNTSLVRFNVSDLRPSPSQKQPLKADENARRSKSDDADTAGVRSPKQKICSAVDRNLEMADVRWQSSAVIFRCC